MKLPLVILVGCEASSNFTWDLARSTAGKYEIKCLRGPAFFGIFNILPDEPRQVVVVILREFLSHLDFFDQKGLGLVLKAIKHEHRSHVIGVNTATFWWQAAIREIFDKHTDEKEAANLANALEAEFAKGT